MNENELRDLLPDERSLPSSRRRDMKERLTVQIQQEEKSSRNHFRLIVGAAAASLIAALGTAAVLISNDEQPDTMSSRPTDVDRSTSTTLDPASLRKVPIAAEVARAEETTHLDYGLRSELVGCFTSDPPDGWDFDGDGRVDQAFEALPLSPSPRAEPAGPEIWAAQCRRILTNYREGADAATDLSIPASVCVGEPYPLVVVALDQADCASAGIGFGVELQEMTAAHQAVIDHMRAVEYALLASPQDCPTAAETEAWARAVLAEEGLDFEVVIDNEPNEEPGGGVEELQSCPREALMDWGAERVTVAPFRS